jgi:hypothetical protein
LVLTFVDGTTILGGCTSILSESASAGAGDASASDPTVSYIGRKRQQAEQIAIATEVATMGDGERRPWKVEHDIPISNERGEVHVIRVFNTALTSCKEIVFSIETGGAAATAVTYTTEVCRNGDQWKWALAEPAIERWGTLQ